MTAFADEVIKELTELKDDIKMTLEEMINTYIQRKALWGQEDCHVQSRMNSEGTKFPITLISDFLPPEPHNI